MNRAQKYLTRSRTYAACAELAGNLALKAILLQMAQHWAHLAAVAERNAVLEARHETFLPSTSKGGDGT